MSNNYFNDPRRRRQTGTGFSPSGRRTALGYWIPLAVTVTAAAVALGAWVWSERDDADSDDEQEYEQQGGGSGGGIRLDPGAEYPPPPDYTSQDRGGDVEDASVLSRFQGALRRSPSPQQIFDGASKRVAAGVAAAGAVFGGALGSIREEEFADHSRWTEEANSRDNSRDGAHTMSGALPTVSSNIPPAAQLAASKKRKTVAIVVSSVTADEEGIAEGLGSHASILSHLPEYVDPDTARVFVLIYAPGVQPRSTSSDPSSSRPPLSIASSYSNILPEEATPSPDQPAVEGSGLAPVSPQPAMDTFEGASSAFKTLYNQAQALVDKETMIMPFSTSNGHVHILRHLSPDVVYIQESLSGDDGAAVQHISGWVRQVVVVIGDEGGRGGLVDTDDESALGEKEGSEKREKWWQREGVIGLGKRIDVVDGLRAGEDWRRRVSGHD